MKLLIAEDEKALNEVITKKLKQEGFGVDSCLDGNEALERLLYTDYDLAVLDIMMPGLSGIQVVSKLRAQGKNTPVIFLTAKDTVSDRVTGLNIGANGATSKWTAPPPIWRVTVSTIGDKLTATASGR